jgi:hypothetical protein
VELLKINPDEIENINKIPFIPIELFKTKKIITGDEHYEKVFKSSGTTSALRSRHFVKDIMLYERSLLECFEYFYGKPEDYCFLALLPAYEENPDSSLIYMTDCLIKKSRNEYSGFYQNRNEKLSDNLKNLSYNGSKTVILGVSYALLDFAETRKLKLNDNVIIIETGGMKGRRKEIVREELHQVLCNSFGVERIHSEYSMTELMSQAYSTGYGRFRCPSWMKIVIRDINDPLTIMDYMQTGAVNIIDLANINSCSFIATQDLGKIYPDETFEILGRYDNSDLRGCNLLID